MLRIYGHAPETIFTIVILFGQICFFLQIRENSIILKQPNKSDV